MGVIIGSPITSDTQPEDTTTSEERCRNIAREIDDQYHINPEFKNSIDIHRANDKRFIIQVKVLDHGTGTAELCLYTNDIEDATDEEFIEYITRDIDNSACKYFILNLYRVYKFKRDVLIVILDGTKYWSGILQDVV